jgi:hypothetical protein
VKLLCVYCDKTTHISSSCPWVKQRKHVTAFVVLGAAGLRCFDVEHFKLLSLMIKQIR